MPSKNESWGIEVGAQALKAMRLSRSGDRVNLDDYEILPFKKILTTPDLNVEEAIQVNLDAFVTKHEADLAKTNVVVSVPGHMAFARFAKLPPVEPKKIPDIVRFEAVQQIPFPIDQVEWDYQVFQQEDSPDVEVGIFAITKDRVMNFLSNYRHVNLRVDTLTLSPLAVYNAFAHETAEDQETEGTVYMDIGTSSTDVIIVEGGGIWLRTLPIGGNNFTEALVRAFKISFPKAEKHKKEAGTSKYSRQIFSAMRPVFADLVQEVQRSIGYYQSMNRDARLKRLVGVGSTFRLPGLAKFLKQQLQIEVVRPEGFKRLNVDPRRESEFADHAINMATAYGLALQGLGLERVSANVMPAHIVKQRMWRAKQPWTIAAAACFAAATGVYAYRHFAAVSAYERTYEQHQAQITSVVNRAEGFVRKLNETASEANPKVRLENLQRMLDYRDLWPKIMQDISLAAAALEPQPELLTAEYDKAKQIPRTERRRIFIDEIQSEYLSAASAGSAGRGGARSPQELLSQTYTADTFWAEGGADAPPPEEGEEPVAGEADSDDDSVDLDSLTTPRFRITVRGTTPYGQAAQLLSQSFIKWLQDNKSRSDRPYRVLVDPETAITSLNRVGESDEAGRSRERGRGYEGGFGGDPYSGGYGGSPYGEGGFGGDPYGGGYGGDPYGGGRVGRVGRTQVGEILPQRPFADEDRSTDSRFEINWVVELLPPDRARDRERLEERLAPEEPEPPAQVRQEPASPEDESPATPRHNEQAVIPARDGSAKDQEVSS